MFLPRDYSNYNRKEHFPILEKSLDYKDAVCPEVMFLPCEVAELGVRILEVYIQIFHKYCCIELGSVHCICLQRGKLH
jgi:hypothetical protein